VRKKNAIDREQSMMIENDYTPDTLKLQGRFIDFIAAGEKKRSVG